MRLGGGWALQWASSWGFGTPSIVQNAVRPVHDPYGREPLTPKTDSCPSSSSPCATSVWRPSHVGSLTKNAIRLSGVEAYLCMWSRSPSIKSVNVPPVSIQTTTALGALMYRARCRIRNFRFLRERATPFPETAGA